MPGIEIFPSIFQMTLLSLCQWAALCSLLLSGAPAPLRFILGAAIVLQMVGQGFGPAIVALCCGRNAGIQRLHLGASYCRLGATGSSMELRPPNIRYLGEWLIILEFRRRAGSTRQHLMLWPDSLSIRDNWRLRRYLESRRRLPLRSGMG
jgi:hypothetical protein